MTAHSPVPWEMRTAANGDVGVRAAGYEGVIAEFFAELRRLGEQRPKEARANALLFIAAPDLLSIVEALVSMRDESDVTYEGAYEAFHKNGAEDVWQRARAAIAKARGE